MIAEDILRAGLETTLEHTHLEGLGELHEGKVRDSYTDGKVRTLVVSDRVSAFDRVLGTIPFKGQVLNQMAAFWFEKTADLVENHVIDVPDPSVTRVVECTPFPVEMVVVSLPLLLLVCRERLKSRSERRKWRGKKATVGFSDSSSALPS